MDLDIRCCFCRNPWIQNVKSFLVCLTEDLPFVNRIIVHEQKFTIRFHFRNLDTILQKSIAIDPAVGPDEIALFLGPQVTDLLNIVVCFLEGAEVTRQADRADNAIVICYQTQKFIYTVLIQISRQESPHFFDTRLAVEVAVGALVALLIWTRFLYSGTCLLFLGLLLVAPTSR